MQKIPVIFRIDKSIRDRMVTAVFPTVPADYFGRQVTIYQRIGQHGGASWEWYYRASHRPATPDEYAGLLDELRSIYNSPNDEPDEQIDLTPVRRITRAHRTAYDNALHRARQSLHDNPAGAPWLPA